MRHNAGVRIGILGPFEVRNDDGTTVAVPGARLRALLARLALDPGRIIPRARLVDWIWGEQPPTDEANAVQALVSRLRRLLPGDVIEGESGGYRLNVAADAVDVNRFERLVDSARSAEPAARAGLLGSALELWRGPAMVDIALRGSDAFDAEVARLDELHLAVLADRVDADLQLGRGPELVSELTDLVATHPLREGFVAALMRALAESGRGSEALTAYQHLRERLADELGVDPSSEISALHTALLRGELGERAESRRTNLRAELTSYIGKDDDIAAVAGLATRHRLVTLTGAGGSGKTRLATEAARTMLAEQPDGGWLVELAPIRTGDELAQVVLTTIGLRDQALVGGASSGDAIDRLVGAVRERAMLLVLDNCEQMIEAAAVFADRVLGECPRLRILATSREPLGITGEVLWQVEPLALPAPGADASAVESSPAVRLLIDRAGAARDDIGADPSTLAAMARICRSLDGMPLAIELAAARLRTMTVDQLERRLDDRFRLLTRGSRTALPRHQTLRAVVDWSWDLLSEPERRVLRRLSVFAGSASLEAAERVCADDTIPGDQVLELLDALVEKSLVLAVGDRTPRYRMLDTIREYAAGRLAEAGEAEPVRQAHVAYFTDLVEASDPHLRRAEQLDWMALLEVEYDNIVAAVRGSIAAEQASEAMRLVGSAVWYWFLGGHKLEGTALSIAAASLPGEVSDETRAIAYSAVAQFVTARPGGHPAQVEEWIHEADRLAPSVQRRHPMLSFAGLMARLVHDPVDFLPTIEPLLTDDDPWVRAVARLDRGRFRLAFGGDDSGVDADLEDALAEFRALGERWGISFALTSLADRHATRGEFAVACEQYEEAVAARTGVGAIEDVVAMRARQAQLYWLLGDERASAFAMAEAQRCADGIVWPDATAEMALSKARLAYWRGDRDEAYEQLAVVQALLGEVNGFRAQTEDLYGYLAEDLERCRAHRREAFDVALVVEHLQMVAEVLVGVADLALRQGEDEQAVRLLAASESLRGGPDHSLPDAARILEDARGRLSETAFAEATEAGQREDWRALAEVTLAS